MCSCERERGSTAPIRPRKREGTAWTSSPPSGMVRCSDASAIHLFYILPFGLSLSLSFFLYLSVSVSPDYKAQGMRTDSLSAKKDFGKDMLIDVDISSKVLFKSCPWFHFCIQNDVSPPPPPHPS